MLINFFRLHFQIHAILNSGRISLPFLDGFNEMNPLSHSYNDRNVFCYFLTVHVADACNRDDPDYLAALETETGILEKRVRACRSRIMVVTCFDVTAA